MVWCGKGGCGKNGAVRVCGKGGCGKGVVLKGVVWEDEVWCGVGGCGKGGGSKWGCDSGEAM